MTRADLVLAPATKAQCRAISPYLLPRKTPGDSAAGRFAGFLSGTNLRGSFMLLEAVSPPVLCSDHMPWLSKEQLTPLNSQPISGLYALHGDVMASAYQRKDLRSLKYPLIRFPSGITRELTVENNSANISVAGGLTVL